MNGKLTESSAEASHTYCSFKYIHFSDPNKEATAIIVCSGFVLDI